VKSEADLAGIDGYPFTPHMVALSSVHPQSTVPLGTVLDGSGQVTDGLYVADASVFPTSSGVNPMLTIMGIAHRAAGIIAAQPASR